MHVFTARMLGIITKIDASFHGNRIKTISELKRILKLRNI